ncbi:MAG: deaminase-reductase protein [Devosia sp.]|uniref:dihydrofolate reductase family protein n=1 Tax=Devosia sp. TaxID=1871048 RepID=UPI00261FF288|nr:dihydrofolate reductase family protein [Devosia sp.]MDB5542665.1 deaminase-reductase protein [Devosia sp.]
MTKVVIDMTMSLDGFVAGPEDGKQHPLGTHGGHHIFDWYATGTEDYRTSLFRPAPGANLDQVKLMYVEAGAYIFGRRTYDITDGWGGAHPVNGAPVFVLTHQPPPAEDVPKGPSNLTFVTDGIASAIEQARAVAGDKDIKLGGASPGKQALAAGLCDEVLVHVAPFLVGGGVRLFDELADGVQLEKLSVSDGPMATHIRYRVVRQKMGFREAGKLRPAPSRR